MKYKHNKTRSIYEIVDRKAMVQSKYPLFDNDPVVIYKNQRGEHFARPAKEFFDGRFTKIEPKEDKDKG